MVKFVIVSNQTHIWKGFLVLAVLLCASVFSAEAQERWAYVSGSTGTDYAADLVQTFDKGFLSCGTVEEALGDREMLVLKVDSNGYTLWERSLSLGGLTEEAVNAIQTSDSGYAIFGTAAGSQVPFMLKLSSTGDSLWSSAPSISSLTTGSGLNVKGAQLADGSYVLYSINSSLELYETKFATDGSLLSSGMITGIVPVGFSTGTFLQDAISTNDGGFVLVGATGDGISQKGFLWKFDNNADSAWSYIIDTADVNIIYGVEETSDGSLLVTGVSQSPMTAALVRVSGAGVHTWSKYFVDPVNFVQGRDVGERNDGSLVMVQILFDAADDSTFESEILSLDATGNLLDQSLIAGGIASTKITKVISTNDGGFAIAGDLKNSPLIGDEDVFLARSSFDGQLPECIFNCVWPGDANNSGFVDMDDLLLLGLEHETATGPVRTDLSTDWYGHDASDWVDTTLVGLNLKYVDADGDGMLNDSDTSGISINYGKGHPVNLLRPAGSSTGSLVLEFGSVAEPLGPGAHDIPILLEDTTGGGATIYGIRFSILYAGNIDPNSVRIEFTDSWMGSVSTELLSLDKNQKHVLRIDGGLTRKDQTNVVGDGPIGHMSIVVIDDIIGRGMTATMEGEVRLSIVDAVATTADGAVSLVEGNEKTIEVLLPTGVGEISQPVIEIFPNPLGAQSGNRLQIRGIESHEINFVAITDLSGRVLAQIPGNKVTDNSLVLPDLESGHYLINFFTTDSNITCRLVIHKL